MFYLWLPHSGAHWVEATKDVRQEYAWSLSGGGDQNQVWYIKKSIVTVMAFVVLIVLIFFGAYELELENAQHTPPKLRPENAQHAPPRLELDRARARIKCARAG